MSLNPVQNRRISALIIALISSVFMASELHAVTVYPDVMGDTVWFRNISENTKSVGDPEPLYGPPTAIVDTLDFNPNNFDFVASSNNSIVDTTDGALSLMIEAKPGYSLETLCFDESGFVNLFAQIGGTSDPFALVTGLIELTINEIDGIPMPPVNLPGVIPTFSPSDGDFQHSVDAGGMPFYNAAWEGSAKFNLDQELLDRRIDFQNGVTKVSVKIDNFLLAAAGAEGSLASIDKKEFMITTETEPVIPEPATIGLALIGALGTMQMRRRR